MSSQDLARCRPQKFIYLTTKGWKTGRPHTVELWFALIGEKVYLSHEGEETHWMKNIAHNENITFEIGGINFNGIAHHLEGDTEEMIIAKAALYKKYYGMGSRETVDDWFSLSRLLSIELT